MEQDPEVISAMKFLDEVNEPTIENVERILRKACSYAYIENKTQGHYNDLFLLIGMAYGKIRNIKELESKHDSI